ncbi:MAG: hypothetical protein ABSG32_10705 [Terriglobia bacterium]
MKTAKHASKTSARASAKPSPKPDVLKLDGNWQGLMKKSLTKKKPPEGWPK